MGPWNNDVDVYRADAEGSLTKLHAFERAGVPTVARLADGTLLAAFQHFPADDQRHFDRVALSTSQDDGKTWTTPQTMSIEGMEPGMARPFDPTLVPLPGGGTRMYFTSNQSPDFRISTPTIHSAQSKDGFNYVYEPGIRFAVEGMLTIDCAVAFHDGWFHLIVPDNGSAEEMEQNRRMQSQPRAGIGYHAVSRDGLNFDRLENVSTNRPNRWLGNMLSDDGLVFVGTGPGPWPLISRDGKDWTTGQRSFQVPGADPGVVKLRDGSWLMLVTSPPRRGNNVRVPAPSMSRAVPTLDAMRQQGEHNGANDRVNPVSPRSTRIQVHAIESKYSVASPAEEGSFTTGQASDLVLGAAGFNRSGGSSLFNHPSGLATDGRSLLMTDRWNHRVLIWKSAPSGNTPPDLVLGQPDFEQNHSGSRLDQLNWPGNIAIAPDGSKIAVTDTNNDRILIWNSFPTKSGQAADVSINLPHLHRTLSVDQGASHAPQPMRYSWPWGVWTDGRKLAVVATHGAAVLIWNAIPTQNDQLPDYVLRPNGSGTPRNVTSDGSSFFAVSDHNYGSNRRPATLVWRRFPNESDSEPDFVWREWMKGSVTPEKLLVMAGIQSVFVWNELPQDSATDPTVFLKPSHYRNGDGPDAVWSSPRKVDSGSV